MMEPETALEGFLNLTFHTAGEAHHGHHHHDGHCHGKGEIVLKICQISGATEHFGEGCWPKCNDPPSGSIWCSAGGVQVRGGVAGLEARLQK